MEISFEDNHECGEIHLLAGDCIVGSIELFDGEYCLRTLFSFEFNFQASDLRTIADKLDELNQETT